MASPVITRARPPRPRLPRRDPAPAGPSPEAPSAAQATPPAPRRTPVLAWALMLPGVLVLSFVAFMTLGTQVSADRAQALLDSQFREQLSQAVAPVGGTVPIGAPVAVLEVPRIGLRQVVVNGSSAEETTTGPGLVASSSLPGQQGVSVVVGRRATFGSPFGDLPDLRVGDEITAVTGQGTFRYRVDVVRRSNAAASKVTVVPARLTLVTSDPAYTPDKQVVVSAALVGKAQPRSTTPVVRATDAPGERTTDGLVWLLLWSQLLLALSALTTWAAMRTSWRAVWIGAVPVLVAVLWHVYENLALLLPNTL